jgi:Leucine-rich repeat (LRR) protein
MIYIKNILWLIFSHLNYNDSLQFALTCQSVYRVFCMDEMWAFKPLVHDILEIRKYSYKRQHEIINELQKIQKIEPRHSLTAIYTKTHLNCGSRYFGINLNILVNLIYLECFVNLKKIPDFSRCVNLTHLKFNHSSLQYLPDLDTFTNLKKLECINIGLKSLPNLNRCVKLEYLDVHNNALTCLPKLTSCKQLLELNCKNNKLTHLPDLSCCTQLFNIQCYGNALTHLPDLSNCTQLKYLACNENNLTILPDLSHCEQLRTLQCDPNVQPQNLKHLRYLYHKFVSWNC